MQKLDDGTVSDGLSMRRRTILTAASGRRARDLAHRYQIEVHYGISHIAHVTIMQCHEYRQVI